MISYSRELEIRQKAINLLRECDIKTNQAISLKYLLMAVRSFDISYENRDLKGLNGFSCYFKEFDKYLIVSDFNGKDFWERNKFTISHEIGHVVLGHLKSLPSSSLLNDKFLEREANIFADELLMPTADVFFNGFKTVEEIQKHYVVSRMAAANKLAHLDKNPIADELLNYICNCAPDGTW